MHLPANVVPSSHMPRAVTVTGAGKQQHADIHWCEGRSDGEILWVQIGAFVNETFQAREGFKPDLFPEGVPTFMGHYHKPHTVQGTSIQYVGSPFQGYPLEAYHICSRTFFST